MHVRYYKEYSQHLQRGMEFKVYGHAGLPMIVFPCQDGKFYDFDYVKHSEGVPRCECGGIVKPDVVLYEEGLDSQTIEESVRAISKAQVLIIGGTSLAVYPAAGLIDYFRGEALVVINKSSTPRDRNADLLIKEPIGQVFSQIKVR